MTSRILTRCPAVNRQSTGSPSRPAVRSSSFQRIVVVVVARFVSAISSSHSIPSAVAESWWWACAWAMSWPCPMSWPTAAPAGVVAISFMPHFGQRPGWSLTTSGCIGQA